MREENIVLGLRLNGRRFKPSFYREFRRAKCRPCGAEVAVALGAGGLVVCYECAERLGITGLADLVEDVRSAT